MWRLQLQILALEHLEWFTDSVVGAALQHHFSLSTQYQFIIQSPFYDSETDFRSIPQQTFDLLNSAS